MGFEDLFNNFYGDKYKWYLIVPLIVFIVCLLLVPFVPMSVDLKGGTVITINNASTTATNKEIKTYLQNEFSLKDVSVTKTNSLNGSVIEIQYITKAELSALKSEITEIKLLAETDKNSATSKALLFLKSNNIDIDQLESKDFDAIKDRMNVFYNDQENLETNKILDSLNKKFGISVKTVNIKEVGATLGAAFYKNALTVSIWAIVLIIIVIFIFFKEVVPSFAVILAGAIDVLGGLAGMTLFNVPLSLVTIPALLMLLGYSIDTDVMLTTKLLRSKEGSIKLRSAEALKTGLMMTSTVIAATLVMFVFSTLYNIQVMYYISVVLLSGSIVDLISTWLMNAPVLLWYLETKKRSRSE